MKTYESGYKNYNYLYICDIFFLLCQYYKFLMQDEYIFFFYLN